MTNSSSVAALYARVSTTDQKPGMQLAALREYAARRGLEALEYLDRGVSGARDARPELDRLVADARRRRFSTVVVWRFDRAARSVEHLARLLREFEALGVGFVSLTEAVDTSTPAGRMLFHMLAAVAEFERELIRERVAAGLAHAKAQGRRVGRPRLALDDDELLRLHGAGLSVREIASTITAGDGKALRHPSRSLVSRELRRLVGADSSRAGVRRGPPGPAGAPGSADGAPEPSLSTESPRRPRKVPGRGSCTQAGDAGGRDRKVKVCEQETGG